jgi:hypothetical protein
MLPAMGQNRQKTRHLLFVDTLRQPSRDGAAMNESEKQFSIIAKFGWELVGHISSFGPIG